MADELIFGHVDGFPPGTRFGNRDDASEARVHRPPISGIAGSWTKGGADSIVVSGGYEDDQDQKQQGGLVNHQLGKEC